MLNQITLACYTQGHKNQSINSEAWSVPELYCSFLKELESGKVVKVNINIRNKWANKKKNKDKYGDVITVRNHFDFSVYSILNKQEKKKMQLETVHKGMMQIAEKEGWSIDSLLDAYNQCLERNLEYQFYVGKPKSSPNRKHKIGLWCNWDLDVFEFYWILFDKQNNELKRERFVSKSPYEGEFVYYVKWNWISESAVVFQDKYKYGKNESWKIDFSDKLSQINKV